MDRSVVVKVLMAVDAESTRRRFDRERKAMGRLSQAPGIVPLYGSGFTPAGQPWLLMPHYERGSLQDVIETAGPLPPEQVRTMGVRIARAVHAAHENGVLHRDLKPANVLVRASGDPDVADFGIAHLLDDTGGTSQALTMTPLYTAPEVFEGIESGPGSDVYSLGALLYALLAGRPAFATEGEGGSVLALMRRINTEDVPALPSHVPPALAAIVVGAMSKTPETRPGSAAQLADALAVADMSPARVVPRQPPVPAPAAPAHPTMQPGVPVPPRQPGQQHGGPVTPPKRRSQSILVIGAVAVLAIAAGGGLLASRFLGTDDPEPTAIVDGSRLESTTVLGDGDDGGDGASNDNGEPAEGTPVDGGDAGFARTAALVAAGDVAVRVEAFSCTGAESAVGIVFDAGRVVTSDDVLRSPWWVGVTSQTESVRGTVATMDLKYELGIVEVDAFDAPRVGPLNAGDDVLFVDDNLAATEARVAGVNAARLQADLPIIDAVQVKHATPAFDETGALVAVGLQGEDDLGMIAVDGIEDDWNRVPPTYGCNSVVRDLDANDAPLARHGEIRELLYFQRLSNAFAVEEWNLVRRYEPGKATMTDEQFNAGWGPLEQSFVYPVSRSDLADGRARWRLGLIGHEVWDGADITTLFCVSWEIDEATGEVIQTNEDTVPVHGPRSEQNPRPGFVDPAQLRPTIDARCPL